jgi:hypothetical protein
MIEKFVKGHLESAEIDFDKLYAPFLPIELNLYINYMRIK